MTVADWVAKILEALSHFVATVGAALAAWLGWHNRKSIHQVHIMINNRMTELLKSTAKEEHAAGRQEGVESEQSRMRPADPEEPEKAYKVNGPA